VCEGGVCVNVCRRMWTCMCLDVSLQSIQSLKAPVGLQTGSANSQLGLLARSGAALDYTCTCRSSPISISQR